MKTVLLYLDYLELNVFDEAISHVEHGDNVYILCCDKSIGHCVNNPYCNSLKCNFCHRLREQMMKKYLPDFKHLTYMSNYLDDDKQAVSENFKLEFDSIEELKEITFHGVEIGFGAFSTYVTLTRICTPAFTLEFKMYLDAIMRAEIRATLAIEDIVKKVNPDLVYFHNGRFAQHKPIYCVARNNHIDFWCTEQYLSEEGECFKNYAFNTVIHDVKSITQKILFNWDSADPNTRELIGHSFYKNRAKGIFAGDKVYVAGQIENKLPDNWNNEVENIVIFNSSDDEYVSISKDFDKGQLYPTQYEALKSIFDYYADDETKHFYVRIHPNLTKVVDISHTSLYTLKYKNVTLIPPSSPISSYTLLDKSSKVIVFHSTIGAEASYWKKPVIALNLSAYEYLNIVYSPKSREALFELISTPNLPAIYNENILKYGYYFMQRNGSKSNCFYDVYRKKKILGLKSFYYNEAITFMGSSILFGIINSLLNLNAKKVGLFSRFKDIPQQTARWINATKD